VAVVEGVMEAQQQTAAMVVAVAALVTVLTEQVIHQHLHLLQILILCKVTTAAQVMAAVHITDALAAAVQVQ